ncbi:MAG: bis(5'-nucleosyl)-tetraphosphatase (symmetrical) YqeK [Clostridia bacterium]|nr:bis(5'-nucleosyl)-tetraphosphatase (symmetrical) YqeK [Clostridia bacterium]
MNAVREARLSLIRERLPLYEDAKRLEHTVGVYKECQWLAKKFGLSEEDSYTVCAAALLHDIAKNLSHGQALEICERYGVQPPAVLAVMHQYTGAFLAREVFGEEIVTDAVCSAILCHTTGKVGMTVTDKMLFVADFTEAGRKYRSCRDIREYLHSECEKINKNEKTALSRLLNDTVKRIVGFTVTYLIEKGKPIDADMILTWNEIVSEN